MSAAKTALAKARAGGSDDRNALQLIYRTYDGTAYSDDYYHWFIFADYSSVRYNKFTGKLEALKPPTIANKYNAKSS